MERLHKLNNTCSRVVFSFSSIFLLSNFLKVNPVLIVWFVNLCWQTGSVTPKECKKNRIREKLVLTHFYKQWKDYVDCIIQRLIDWLLQKWFCSRFFFSNTIYNFSVDFELFRLKCYRMVFSMVVQWPNSAGTI